MIKEKAFVTGGAGFVGQALCRELAQCGYQITCYDKLEKGVVNPSTVSELEKLPDFKLIQGDILDADKLKMEMGCADVIIHLAAVSAVDRSITDPMAAFMVNAVGTITLLEAARAKGIKRVHYVSTDEVFGHAISGAFDENSPAGPRNPYAAGKLGGEAVILAWGATYGMEVTISNSVNNYGPHQAPEKLIPRLTVRGILGNTLPVYGDGQQVREWLFVKDHVGAIMHIVGHGACNERYCVGSGETLPNIEIVTKIISVLGLDNSVIEHVLDRKGHDMRYAVDTSKLQNLGWQPQWSLSDAMEYTIDWYRQNREWWQYYLSIHPDLAPATGTIDSEKAA